MDDAAQYYRQLGEQRRERQQSATDDYRKQQITQYMQVSNNLHKQVALLLNPDTMQPLPGKEQQVATLRQNMSDVDTYVKKLYDPNFNPLPQGEDPIHKLTDKLHLTKPPQPKPAPDAKVSGLQEQFGQTGERTPFDLSVQRTEKNLDIDNARTLLKKYGATDKTIQDVTEGMLGVKQSPVRPTLKLYKLPDGSMQWLNAADPDSIPEGAQAVAPGSSSSSGPKAWMEGPDGKLVPARVENGQLVPMTAAAGYTPVLPSTLPTQSSSTSTYNPETGATSTSRSSQKVIPGQSARPGARRSTTGGGGQGQSKIGQTGGRVAAMADDWEKHGIPPSAKDKPAVEQYMKAHGKEPTEKPTGTERKLADDIKKVEPKVQELSDFLESNNLTEEGQGGMFSPSSWLERSKVEKAWQEYQHGIPPSDKKLGQLIKFAAAIKIMGAAPWMSIGRGRYLYSEIVQHLPNTTDTPAQLYEKIQFYKTILDDAKGSLPKSLQEGGSSGETGGNVIKWTRDAQGNPVPAQ